MMCTTTLVHSCYVYLRVSSFIRRRRRATGVCATQILLKQHSFIRFREFDTRIFGAGDVRKTENINISTDYYTAGPERRSLFIIRRDIIADGARKLEFFAGGSAAGNVRPPAIRRQQSVITCDEDAIRSSTVGTWYGREGTYW